MKRLLLICLLALVSELSFAQTLVNCAPGVPCTTSGPSNTGTGDRAWLSFGKINSDLLTLAPVFSSAGGTILGTISTGVMTALTAPVIPIQGLTPNSSGAAAANAAIISAACAVSNSNLLLPAGVFYTNGVICDASGVSLGGAPLSAAYDTELIFVPTADAVAIASLTPNVADAGTAMLFAKNGGTTGNIMFTTALHDLWIKTNNTTFSKYGIRFIEQAESAIINVRVEGFYGGDSVGLQLAGHEAINVDRSLFYASVPGEISPAPGIYGGQHYDCDTCTIKRSQFLSNLGAAPTSLPKADLLIDPGVFLSNVTVDSVNLVGGQYGVYDVSAISSGASSYTIKFSNVRHEQSQGTNTWGYYFDNTGSGNQIQALSFDQIYGSRENGTGACWYFKGVILPVQMSNSVCTAPTSGYTVDDEDVLYAMTWTSMNTSTKCGGASGPSFLKVPSGMVLSDAQCYGSSGPILVSGVWTRGLPARVSLTPAAGATDNLQPTNSTWPNTVRTLAVNTVNCPCNFTGLVSTNASDGQTIRVDNTGANALTLNHQNAGSSVNNRFQAPGGVDFVLATLTSVNVQFDQTAGYWFVVP